MVFLRPLKYGFWRKEFNKNSGPWSLNRTKAAARRRLCLPSEKESLCLTVHRKGESALSYREAAGVMDPLQKEAK